MFANIFKLATIKLHEYDHSSTKSFIFGLNPLSKSNKPTSFQFGKFKQLASSWSFMAAINEYNELIIWDRDDIELFDAQTCTNPPKIAINLENSRKLTDLSFDQIAVSQNSILGISHDHLYHIQLNGSYHLLDIASPLQMASGDHSALIHSKDALYEYQMDLLNNATSKSTNQLQKIPISNVLQIASGNDHFLILTRNGLFGMGSNINGQLSLPNYTNYPLSPISTPNHDYLNMRIFAGGNQSYLYSNYKLYSCGNGQYGQLGTSKLINKQNQWCKIPKLSDLTQFSEIHQSIQNTPILNVICGKFHTVVELDSDCYNKNELYGNDLLAFGNNQFGQIGCDSNKKMISKPTRLVQMKNEHDNTCLKTFKSDLNYQKIHCGPFYTLIYQSMLLNQ
eukprot:NODE_269_length_11261_cov_0.600359.p1 type:complete len:394 gc:universal NODE_269_length_11261_cov_0.600359:8138-6957(-)